MNRFKTLLFLAFAETRRSRGRLAFCLVAIAVGVGALTFIRAVTMDLEASLAREARQLMGADLVMDSNLPLDCTLARAMDNTTAGDSANDTHLRRTCETAESIDAQLRELGARSSKMTAFTSMLAVVEGGDSERESLLVQVRGADQAFPFYGKITTEPPEVFTDLYETDGRIIIEEKISVILALEPGDRIQLGESEFVVQAIILPRAGQPGAGSGIAPVVYIPQSDIEDTGLVRRGSRIRHMRFYETSALGAAEIESFKADVFDEATESRVNIRTSREAAGGLQRFLNRLSHFLTVVGLVVLLLGAIGIGSAMHVFLRDRILHGAVLRSVGARPRDVFWIYLMVGLLLGVPGSLLGAVPGSFGSLALGPVLEGFAGDLLPVSFQGSYSWFALFTGFFTGLIASILAVLLPVYRTYRASPLRVLKSSDDMDESDSILSHGYDFRAHLKRLRDRWLHPETIAALILFIVAFVLAVGFVFSQTDSFRLALAFTGSVAAAIVILNISARLIMWIARQLASRVSGYHLKQGIANLYRPGNQTSTVITAIGAGVFLLSAVLLLESSLTAETALDETDKLPDTFLVDVQPDQLEPLKALLEAYSIEELKDRPLIAGRFVAINDEPINTEQVERNSVRRTWEDRLRTRTYFVSYRGDLLESEEIVDGEFWDGPTEEQEISVSEDWAERMEVEVGDTLTFELEGLPVKGRVTSLRRVRWQAMEPNVMILYSPGFLSNAPAMHVASFRFPGERSEYYKMEAELVRRFPNVTVYDVRDIVENVTAILGRIGSIVTLLSILAAVNGTIILAGSIASGRFARLREAMLLKVLGADRRDLVRILLGEYITLGICGAFIGWFLAEGILRPLLDEFLELNTSMPYGSLAVLLFATIALNTLVGLLISRDVTRAKPVDILRSE